LLECAVDISTRKKLIHTMPPNTDRPINRAMVVGCAVSATRNHLKLHEPSTLKVLSSNIHAKTRKLWKHSAVRLAASRTNAAHQSANRPLMNSVCPPRRPLHSPGLMHVASCWRPAHNRDRRPTLNPRSARCQPVPNFPRLRALALFGRRPAQSAAPLVVAGRPKTRTIPDMTWIGCEHRTIRGDGK
jgi:hypothetical protein